MKYLFYNVLLWVLVLNSSLLAQDIDSIARINKKLFWTMYGSTYAASMTALYFAWYDDYSKTSFHWFNDAAEWQQMDKMGHVFTAYQLNRLTHKSMMLAGYSHHSALFYSAGISFVLMNSIELFDGFSEKWGASYTDISSNLAGIVLFTTQEYFFKNQPIQIKFSYHFTPLAQYRPDALGKTHFERLLKDYNGQTYWLDINISSLLKNFKPKWLNISMGYSAYNMLSAKKNDLATMYPQAFYKLKYDKLPYRRFFISVDIEPKNMKISKKWGRNFLSIFNSIKLPLPTLEFNGQQVIFHPLYF